MSRYFAVLPAIRALAELADAVSSVTRLPGEGECRLGCRKKLWFQLSAYTLGESHFGRCPPLGVASDVSSADCTGPGSPDTRESLLPPTPTPSVPLGRPERTQREGRRASPGTALAGTLILDFPALRTARSTFPWARPPPSVVFMLPWGERAEVPQGTDTERTGESCVD